MKNWLVNNWLINSYPLIDGPATKLKDFIITEGQSAFAIVVVIIGVIMVIKRKASEMVQGIVIIAGAALFVFSPAGTGKFFADMLKSLFGIT